MLGNRAFDYVIFAISVGVLIPNTLRVKHDWQMWSNRRRAGEALLLAGLVLLPILVFTQSALVAARAAPRQLSLAQISILHAHIDGFRGQTIFVVADTRGADSHDLAEEIFAQLVEAGWNVQPDPDSIGKPPNVLAVTMTSWGPSEIQIGTDDYHRLSKSAQALYDAFQDMGMRPSVVSAPRLKPSSEIRLVVLRRGGD